MANTAVILGFWLDASPYGDMLACNPSTQNHLYGRARLAADGFASGPEPPLRRAKTFVRKRCKRWFGDLALP